MCIESDLETLFLSSLKNVCLFVLHTVPVETVSDPFLVLGELVPLPSSRRERTGPGAKAAAHGARGHLGASRAWGFPKEVSFES